MKPKIKETKELEEVKYDMFHVFYKDKSSLLTIDPRMLNRKYYKVIGKYFTGILKDLMSKNR